MVDKDVEVLRVSIVLKGLDLVDSTSIEDPEGVLLTPIEASEGRFHLLDWNVRLSRVVGGRVAGQVAVGRNPQAIGPMDNGAELGYRDCSLCHDPGLDYGPLPRWAIEDVSSEPSERIPYGMGDYVG